MVELLYGLSEEGQLMHVNDVPNGIACRCRCPHCSAPLVAKNNGETIAPHFAHASGTVCSGAHESELHLLAKEVISTDKTVMLPAYGNVYPGGAVHFDKVEVEQRNDLAMLQPDACGVVFNKKTGADSRLWIEIMVTHAIGPDKRELIRRNGISCVEINLSRFINQQVTRAELADFLTREKDSREWTNNPLLEQKRREASASQREYASRKAEERNKVLLDSMSAKEVEQHNHVEQDIFLHEHKDCCILMSHKCYTCRHHSARQAIFEEAKRLHLPSWVREALESNLLYWTQDNVQNTVEYNGCYLVRFDNYIHLLPTSSPDLHGRTVSAREIKQNEQIIPFLLNTVPAILASEGIKCKHNVQSFASTNNKYSIACNMPNVVNKHRRK